MAQKFATAKGYMTDLGKGNSKVDINVDTTGAKKKITGLTSDIDRLQQQTKNFKPNIDVDTTKAKSAFSSLADACDTVQNAVYKVQLAFWTVQTVLAAGLSVKFAVDLDDQMEKWDLQLRVITKDATLAKQIMSQLQEFANNTPFKTESIHEAGVALTTAGIGADQLMGYMQAASDWAAAFNTDISETARVFARINSGDTGEALERARDFGISMRDLWAQGIRFDAGGQVLSSMNDTMDAVKNAVTLKTAGMSQELSKTWSGMWSTFTSLANQAVRDLTGGTFQDIKAVLSNIINQLKELSSGGFFTSLGEQVKSFFEAFSGIKQAINDIFSNVNLTQGLSAVFTSLFQMVKDGIEVVGELASSFAELGTKSGVISALGDALKIISEGVKSVSNALVDWDGKAGLIEGVAAAFVVFKIAANIDTIITSIYVGAKTIEDSMLVIRTALAATTFTEFIANFKGLQAIIAGLSFASLAKDITVAATAVRVALVSIASAGAAFLTTPIGLAILAIATAAGVATKAYIDMKSAQAGQAESEKTEAEMLKKLADLRAKANSPEEIAKAQQANVNKAFSDAQVAQKDVQNATAVSNTKIAVETAYHANSVALAKERYQVAADNLQKLSIVEASYQSIVEGNGKEYKPTQAYLDAKKAYAEALSAVFEAQITQADALGQYVYQAQKLIAEAQAVEALGGDSTVKRYEALKLAITEYLADLDTLRKAQIDAWASMSEMNLVMNNYRPDGIKAIGTAWSDTSTAVINYKQTASVNLDALQRQEKTLASSQKVLDATRFGERLIVLQQILASEQLGAQQRKQLIAEEAQTFNSYTKAIGDGIKDAMSKIESLQQKMISSAASARALLVEMGASDKDVMDAYNAQVEVYKNKLDKTVADMKTMYEASEEMRKLGFNVPDVVKVSDVKDAYKNDIKNAADQISQLRQNMATLVEDAKQIGALAAQNYFAEWSGYINNLRQMINQGLQVPISFDMSGLDAMIEAARDKLQSAFTNLQPNIILDAPKPIINYNSFALSPTYQIQVQGSTIKDVQDIIAQTTDNVGRTMRDALQEAVVQYGL
jgi:hypothetical protein